MSVIRLASTLHYLTRYKIFPEKEVESEDQGNAIGTY
jgi:hypothetical protein